MNLGSVSGRAGRRRPVAEINVIPYIDVCLVLLIIFMVTAPMMQSGVEVSLPQAEAKTIEPKDTPPAVVSIQADGTLYLDVNGEGEQRIADSALVERLLQVVAENRETQVFIRGDSAVPYGRVVDIMAAIKRAGILSVGLMTRPPDVQ
jgi:biopolymer transport protein TolR